ncbi:MAG: aldo/keto reductase [Rhodospirillales bacterium]|nr:aldo/keto reductase [Rhodospirillales bacterium]
MRQRNLAGRSVGAIGYGAMVLEGYYGPIDEAESLSVLRAALNAGATLIDTSDAYGNGHNERLVGRALDGRTASALIATKFGIVYEADRPATEFMTGWGFPLRLCGRPDYARRCLDRSLANLGVERIDLWQLHFPDPALPIAETVGAMAGAVRAGKVAAIGLCNANAQQVRQAHAEHPIASVQNEFSLWRREDEVRLFPTLRELGIAYIPWSPLGSGFLAGTRSEPADGDFRRYNPRFQAGNLDANRARFAPLDHLARQAGITPAQLALAWILSRGDFLVPIPGSRSARHIEENIGAAAVELPSSLLAELDSSLPTLDPQGGTLVT